MINFPSKVLLSVALMATVAACAEINSAYLNEFMKLKEEMGDEVYEDGQRLLSSIVAWRKSLSHNDDYQSIVSELIHERPIQFGDIPYLLSELKTRALNDPDSDIHPEVDGMGRKTIVKMARRYVIDSCKYYEFTFEDLFKQLEAEDPAMKSYSTFGRSETTDLYNGWATFKLCKNLLEQFYKGDILEDMLNVAAKN